MENSMSKKEPVISDDLLKLLTHHEISPNKVIFSASLTGTETEYILKIIYFLLKKRFI